MWTQGGKGGLTFLLTGGRKGEPTLRHLTSLRVDGQHHSAAGYDAEFADGRLRLEPELLDTLSAGEHSFVVELGASSAKASFFVRPSDGTIPAPEPAAERAAPNGRIWLIPGLAAVFAGYALYRRKKGDGRAETPDEEKTH